MNSYVLYGKKFTYMVYFDWIIKMYILIKTEDLISFNSINTIIFKKIQSILFVNIFNFILINLYMILLFLSKLIIYSMFQKKLIIYCKFLINQINQCIGKNKLAPDYLSSY